MRVFECDHVDTSGVSALLLRRDGAGWRLVTMVPAEFRQDGLRTEVVRFVCVFARDV